MTSKEKNVSLLGTPIPVRLKLFREQRQLTKTDLAEKAGLNYRTVHEIEAGRRERALEKTLMLLASALDVTYEDLVNGNSVTGGGANLKLPTGSGRRRAFLLVATIAVLFCGFFLVKQFSIKYGLVSFEEGNLAMVGRIFGTEIWRHKWKSEVRFCQKSPWSDEILLVGLSGKYSDGGRMLALDRSNGEILWEVRPDFEALKRAFGDEIIDSGNFNCHRFVTLDIDGDGVLELVVYFGHSTWYPASLCLVDRNGDLRGHYANCGNLYDLAVVDLDQDGKDELLAAGTNNSKVYQGGTLILLDEDHFVGASIDSCAHSESSEPDSALVRLVFPMFPEPFMDQMKIMRLVASRIRSNLDDKGNTVLNLDIGENDTGQNLVVRLDDELRPQSIAIGDQFLFEVTSTWPDSLVKGTGPADPAWRLAWLATHKRFEAGHWPPN